MPKQTTHTYPGGAPLAHPSIAPAPRRFPSPTSGRSPAQIKHDRSRPSPAARGYGKLHRQLRKRWRILVDLGGVRCARCAELIHPLEPWDLGHDDHDRTVYTGPEHRSCNRATSSRRRVISSRVW